MKESKPKENMTTPEDVADEVAEKVRESVLTFINALREETSEEKATITIDELELNWDILDKETKKTYAEMVSRELSRINEKPLINTKKENLN
jgi:hypothetical protein